MRREKSACSSEIPASLKAWQSVFLNILHHQPCHLQVQAATLDAYFCDHRAYFCFGSSRTYATNFSTSSGLILAPKAGIFPLPLVITSLSAASLCFCTSSERRSLAWSALPLGLSPLPSAE